MPPGPWQQATASPYLTPRAARGATGRRAEPSPRVGLRIILCCPSPPPCSETCCSTKAESRARLCTPSALPGLSQPEQDPALPTRPTSRGTPRHPPREDHCPPRPAPRLPAYLPEGRQQFDANEAHLVLLDVFQEESVLGQVLVGQVELHLGHDSPDQLRVRDGAAAVRQLSAQSIAHIAEAPGRAAGTQA